MALLSGIRVIDFSRLLPGAALTQLLADMGADVIKVEHPRGGDDLRRAGPQDHGTAAPHLFLDRGKRSVALDLKDDDDRAAAVALVLSADAVVESFRPGVAERLGVGPIALRERKPALAYCSINGYGSAGPRAATAGHDLNYLAFAGVLDFGDWTPESGPRAPGVPLADVVGGALGAVGVVAALLAALRTGEGTHIEVALADAAFWAAGVHLSGFLVDGAPQGPRSAALNGGWPCYRVYACADGRHVVVGAIEPHFWAEVVDVLARPDLLERQHDPAAIDDVAAIFATAPQASWVERFAGRDASVSPVRRFEETVADPQFAPMIVEMQVGGETIRQPGTPLRSPDIAVATRPPALAVGGDTDAVLAELGLRARPQAQPPQADPS